MDLDGNGRLDLVSGSDDCCNWDHEFFVFRRGPDGRFGPREGIRTRETPVETRGLMRTRVYVADWDGDGRPDLIGNGGLGRSSGILLGPGPLADRAEIELTRRIDSSEPLRLIHTRPNVADWDGDGLPDLLVGGTRGRDERGVYLLRGVEDAGESRLAAPELLVAPDGASVNGLDVVDWDGDGVLDLIVGLTWWERVEGKGSRRTSRSQVWVYRRIPPE